MTTHDQLTSPQGENEAAHERPRLEVEQVSEHKLEPEEIRRILDEIPRHGHRFPADDHLGELIGRLQDIVETLIEPAARGVVRLDAADPARAIAEDTVAHARHILDDPYRGNPKARALLLAGTARILLRHQPGSPGSRRHRP